MASLVLAVLCGGGGGIGEEWSQVSKEREKLRGCELWDRER